MTQYIDKSTLVAEIKKRLKEYQESADAYYIPAKRELKEILSFTDTLEVKEVDLEKEIYEYMKLHHLHIKDGGRIVFENDDTPNFMCDFRDIAKHFFELGLKAKGVEGICKISETECPNFDEAQGTNFVRK